MSNLVFQAELCTLPGEDDAVDEFVGSKAEVGLWSILDLTLYSADVNVVVVVWEAGDVDAVIGCGHFGHT
jgi:hypothetical protein